MLCSSGNSLADGMVEPCLQKSGLSRPRTAAVSHTRPFLSNMELWLLTLVSQIFLSPQYGDGCIGFSAAACPGPRGSACPASRTGARK